jgi:hypothetical protein
MTISSRPPARIAIGVLQPVVSARFVHQRRAPVFASNAAMKPPFW